MHGSNVPMRCPTAVGIVRSIVLGGAWNWEKAMLLPINFHYVMDAFRSIQKLYSIS